MACVTVYYIDKPIRVQVSGVFRISDYNITDSLTLTVGGGGVGCYRLPLVMLLRLCFNSLSAQT